MLTAGELFEKLKYVDPDTPIRFQWIEDKYINGRVERFIIDNQPMEKIVNGWETFDLSCDEGCESQNISFTDEPVCAKCSDRNRYISASRCFIHDGNIYIDGHY